MALPSLESNPQLSFAEALSLDSGPLFSGEGACHPQPSRVPACTERPRWRLDSIPAHTGPEAVREPCGARGRGLAQVCTRFGRSPVSSQVWPRFLSDSSAEGAPWGHFRVLISCAAGESLDLWPLHRLTNNRCAGNTAAPERERLVFPNLWSCVLSSQTTRQPAGQALGLGVVVS